MRHEETYLGYQLVAQKWQGSYQGRAWAEGEKISATGETLDEVIRNLKQLIPKGGAKNPIDLGASTMVVGTANSVGRVFHRPKCGWMKNVSSDDEIQFASREAAMARGFTSCSSCRA